ncbi:MAG: Flp pilus assembly complex ATPase component TadA [Candidatus Pacebacteria bacterium]|jgi:type IV pilus assembly protein PilB|nr:Flp pilus assembly complex ATPase component TadA [Candidatus Paceibacterota bacterium]MBT3511937.1 Flp pilus assembly complex ATPase component TadA [Candidatus Paceibacterota bacterium]MBT4005259.1 Flp pilus assembly complex ATPase component TadA [Candidatus Paceibacterota bacterium]MBT4358979.1 Flp pilus assembly complex ATPase component TadA [Candidatus Paceibacterota bacterium]MBT4680456.1 Flp pilus assembly complex ATPase component TadA [Candidatus Paceibacterota bacterium]
MTEPAQVPPIQPVSAQPTTVPLADQQITPAPTQPSSPPLNQPVSPVPQPVVQPAVTQNQDQKLDSILEILVSKQHLTSEDAEKLSVEQLSTGKTIEALLKKNKTVSEEVLTMAKADLYHVPFINISEIGVSPEALNALPESVARRYQMLPFSISEEDKVLKVAMQNPLDVTAIDFAQQKTGFRIEAHYATSSDIEQKIAERYAQSLSGEVTKALEETSDAKNKNEVGLADLSQGVVRQAPITKIVETVLSFAMKARASDVHIEPEIERTRIRYRIDGILQEKLILPRSVHDAVVSRIKILSRLKIDEKRVPQDGRFSFESEGAEVDLRVSTLPTVHGEKVVMRLLKKNMKVPTLSDLGLDGLALSRVREAIKVPNGIVLITGPTGSGKTTTLYSILDIINSPKVNILTLEDPVEYQMNGINQVQINPQAGLTFANGLRSFLRQDPNIIMVGEIRDSETVGLAIQASLTGHLVFSTLHTNSAAGALPRLVDMGAEAFLLASSIQLIMAQRVVRRINQDFIEEYQPEPEIVKDVMAVLGNNYQQWCQNNGKDPNKMVLYRPKKNRPQNEPEYKGRIGIYEVMPISPEVSKMILKNASSAELEQAGLKNGMLLMKQDGYLKALRGLTTIEEVIRVAEV